MCSSISELSLMDRSSLAIAKCLDRATQKSEETETSRRLRKICYDKHTNLSEELRDYVPDPIAFAVPQTFKRRFSRSLVLMYMIPAIRDSGEVTSPGWSWDNHFTPWFEAILQNRYEDYLDILIERRIFRPNVEHIREIIRLGIMWCIKKLKKRHDTVERIWSPDYKFDLVPLMKMLEKRGLDDFDFVFNELPVYTNNIRYLFRYIPQDIVPQERNKIIRMFIDRIPDVNVTDVNNVEDSTSLWVSIGKYGSLQDLYDTVDLINEIKTEAGLRLRSVDPLELTPAELNCLINGSIEKRRWDFASDLLDLFVPGCVPHELVSTNLLSNIMWVVQEDSDVPQEVHSLVQKFIGLKIPVNICLIGSFLPLISDPSFQRFVYDYIVYGLTFDSPEDIEVRVNQRDFSIIYTSSPDFNLKIRHIDSNSDSDTEGP